MVKIFCIGFNKTGTLSLHNFFESLGFKSTHDPFWWYFNKISDFDKFDAYSDGYERYKGTALFPDLEFLESSFDCKFILNTRQLDKWLLSRFRHNHPDYLIGHASNKFDDKLFLRWVNDRNYWHQKVYDYFKDKDNLLIVNIDDDENMGYKICDFLGVERKHFPHTHKTVRTFGQEQIQNFLDKYVDKDDWASSTICKLK